MPPERRKYIHGWENEIPVKKAAPVFPQSMQPTTHQIIHQIIIWSNIAEDITNKSAFFLLRHFFESCKKYQKIIFFHSYTIYERGLTMRDAIFFKSLSSHQIYLKFKEKICLWSLTKLVVIIRC